ncbi:MAG: PEP-CTERM sorting domain-containing protein [Phycisphaerae bacterium]|jgi:hypothetical protein
MKNAIIAIMLAMTGVALGDTVELPLNCVGTYDVNAPPWTMDFDLGVTFSEISNVYIDWSGEINAMLYQISGNLTPSNRSLIAGIGAIPGEGWLRSAWVQGGASTYPAPEPFNVRSEFYLSGPSATWNSLLDGKDTVTILCPGVMGDPFPIYQGSAVLNNATLVIKGTVVPEPATLLLFALGGLFLKRGRNNK